MNEYANYPARQLIKDVFIYILVAILISQSDKIMPLLGHVYNKGFGKTQTIVLLIWLVGWIPFMWDDIHFYNEWKDR